MADIATYRNRIQCHHDGKTVPQYVILALKVTCCAKKHAMNLGRLHSVGS